MLLIDQLEKRRRSEVKRVIIRENLTKNNGFVSGSYRNYETKFGTYIVCASVAHQWMIVPWDVSKTVYFLYLFLF